MIMFELIYFINESTFILDNYLSSLMFWVHCAYKKYYFI
jgi:hypothetical protein